MKKLAILLSLFPTIAAADGLTTLGLDDPEVMKPQSEWTGFYAGLSYGKTTSTEESFRCFKLGQPKDCDDPIFDYYPEYKEVVTETTESSDEDFGAFAGYRHDFGRVVGGFELGKLGGFTSAEAQLGLDLGQILLYGVAGASEEESFYGAGADMKIGERLLIGLKYTDQVTSVRAGIRF